MSCIEGPGTEVAPGGDPEMEYNQAAARQRRETSGRVVKCAMGSMNREGGFRNEQ